MSWSVLWASLFQLVSKLFVWAVSLSLSMMRELHGFYDCCSFLPSLSAAIPNCHPAVTFLLRGVHRHTPLKLSVTPAVSSPTPLSLSLTFDPLVHRCPTAGYGWRSCDRLVPGPAVATGSLDRVIREV